jgi:hypothetical protein
MEKHCNYIVIPMSDTESFNITLPKEALEMIDKGLVHFGLYGKKRATVCSGLILDALKRSEVREQVREGRARYDATEKNSG